MSQLKIRKTENNGVVYSNPSDLGLTVRFKQNDQMKKLDNLPVANYLTEIIVNDDFQIPLAEKKVIDAISIRVRVSGTHQSKARIKELLKMLGTKFETWADEDVFSGFRPQTPPEA